VVIPCKNVPRSRLPVFDSVPRLARCFRKSLRSAYRHRRGSPTPPPEFCEPSLGKQRRRLPSSAAGSQRQQLPLINGSIACSSVGPSVTAGWAVFGRSFHPWVQRGRPLVPSTPLRYSGGRSRCGGRGFCLGDLFQQSPAVASPVCAGPDGQSRVVSLFEQRLERCPFWTLP